MCINVRSSKHRVCICYFENKHKFLLIFLSSHLYDGKPLIAIPAINSTSFYMPHSKLMGF